MSPERAAYACARCGRKAMGYRPRQCSTCGAFAAYALVAAGEVAQVEQPTAPASTAPELPPGWADTRRVELAPRRRLQAGCRAWEAVTGGAVVGGVYLVGGTRGAGKSRYLLALLSTMAQQAALPLRVLHSEQQRDEVERMAREVKAADVERQINDGGDVSSVPAQPSIVLVDSLRAARWGDEPARGGSDAERLAMRHLQSVAVAGAVVVIVQHVDEDNDFMGGKLVPSLADCVLLLRALDLGAPTTPEPRFLLECPAVGGVRKNRFGPSEVSALLRKDAHAGGRLTALEVN